MPPVIQLTQRWSDNSAVALTETPLGFNSFPHPLLTDRATSPVAVSTLFYLSVKVKAVDIEAFKE